MILPGKHTTPWTLELSFVIQSAVELSKGQAVELTVNGRGSASCEISVTNFAETNFLCDRRRRTSLCFARCSFPFVPKWSVASRLVFGH